MPDPTAQVFIAAKIHGGEDCVELPLDYLDIRPWNPAKVHIKLDPDQVYESIIKEHRAYIDLEEQVEDLQETIDDMRIELHSEKENASKLRSALASIKREVDAIID